MTTSEMTTRSIGSLSASRRAPRVLAQEAARIDRAHIETARKLAASRTKEAPLKPTLEQVQLVVENLCKGTSLRDTAKTLSLANDVDADNFVLDIVSTYGTWLAHSSGSTGAVIDWSASADSSQSAMFDDQGLPLVRGPQGYHPSEPHKRDVTKALAAVVMAGQSSDVIGRFFARTYTTRQSRLSYPVVAGVWGFSVMNRLGSLAQVSKDPGFLNLVVEAYDLLDVSRQDGLTALDELLTCDTDNAEAIRQYAGKASWLAERQMLTISRAAARSEKDAVAHARLSRELGYLQAAFAAGTLPLPQGVRHLTLGQVQRIATNSGVQIEPNDRVEVADLRSGLKALGLGSDTDVLLGAAVTCAESGTLDRFWEILGNRVAGDPSWMEDLSELLA